MVQLAISLTLISSLLFPGLNNNSENYDKFWPQWRGPEASGVAPAANPPVEWNENKNIRWKYQIPGYGNSTPVIWADRVFLTTSIKTDEKTDGNSGGNQPEWMRGRGVQPTHVIEFTVLAINRQDGTLAWQHTPRKEKPHEGTHQDGSWAANSPVTDGEHLFAYFGSRGLYCYDMDGKLIWQKDFGDMRTRNGFGEGSSPALFGDKLVVNWDHEGDSFIVALDKTTGNTLWKQKRDERTSWSTPLIVEVNGKPQVIVNATNKIRSYDLATGDLIWETGGMTVNAIPSPVEMDGKVFLMSGFRGSALKAIDLSEAQGDISGTEAVLWSHDRDTPYVPSPLLYDGHLYFLKVNSAVLSCFNARTGEEYYSRQRLEGLKNIYASPAGAAGRVYLVGRAGTAMVIKNGPEFEVLATNTLDDHFDASPAIVDNELYLRGSQYLYCIAEN